SSSTRHDTASWSVNPLFTSASDLHIKNPLLKGAGTPVTGVTTDIDGQVRNSSRPDIGSDEFKLSADDASIISLLNPVTGACTGNLPIEVVLKNYGENNLKNVSISW